jgi:hypothetical protein
VKLSIRSIVAAGAALAVAAGALAAGTSPAFAATPPPWEPDSNALGTISFYNAAGAAITGGDLQASPVANYAVASGPGRTGDTKAQLRAYTPQSGVLPGLWTGDVLTASTNYPNTTAPANIAAMTLPVASGASTDFSMATYIGELPNTQTATGYPNMYELRLYTSGVGQGAGTTYYRVDIMVTVTGSNTAGVTGTWSIAYPVPATPTTTSISATPPSPAPSGSTVTLSATVAPAAAGGVHFFDGATDLGAATYNATTGAASLVVHPADGSHSYTAQFISTDPAFNGSTSTVLSYTVSAALTPTTTALVASPTSPAIAGSGGTAAVTLTATVGPVNVPGTVTFFDGATSLGAADTYTTSTGIATKAVSLSSAGSPHFLTATFAPSDGTHAASTSSVLNYVVLPANYGTAGIPITATDNTQPYAGALSLVVAAGTAVSLTQVNPTTAAGHPVVATDPTGHRHAWVFDGSLSGVAVNDTRPTEPGWTLTGQATDFTGGIPAKNLGWTPALVATGSDAEGVVTAGAAVASYLANIASNGLASPGSNLATTAAGNGLGTQNLSASLELRIPDTSPTGTYASTLTLTLVSP